MNPTQPTRYASRASFEKACLSEVSKLLKGASWKRKQNTAFCSCDGYFFIAALNVHRNAARSVASLEVKPLVVDEILWDIMEMSENNGEPLSFRARGAFTCPALPMKERDLEEGHASEREIAAAFVAFSNQAMEEARILLRRREFLELLLNHSNHLERGSYAITQITCLIQNARYMEAKNIAEEYVNGVRSSSFRLSIRGESFEQMALTWLAARSDLH